MARDNQLKFTFSTVGAGTNLASVGVTLGGRSGAIKLVSTASNWAVAYSDALNVGRFRDQQADQSLLVSQVVTSAIGGDPAVFGSTASGEYFLRASVAPVGFFGPAPCQIVVQGNYDTGAGAAPAQSDSNWLPISSIGTCAANGSAISVGTMTLGTSAQFTAGYTAAAGAPAVGSIYCQTQGTGVTSGVPYIVTATGSTVTIANISGATVSATANASGGLVGNFGGRAITLVANAAVTGNLLQADIVPQIGDAVFFSAVSATTLSANTLYFVTSVNTQGLFTLSTTFGGTAATVSAVVSGTGVTYGFDRIPALFVSDTRTNGVYTSVSASAGTTAVPHGLQVGSVVVLQAATTPGGGMTVDVPYYVNTVPSSTTFTLSATINGSTITAPTGTAFLFYTARTPKIVNVQIAKTARQYLRAALVQQNGTVAQSGYFVFNFADLSMGKDSAQVP